MLTTTKLFQGIEYEGVLPDHTVSVITQDSRKACDGAVFVCVVGRTSDGHKFAQKALDEGACLIVSERALGLPNEVVVKNTRLAYALLCQNFFDRPAEKLKLIGVTGTNGKTTIANELKQVLTIAGEKCGLIGTICSEIGDMVIPARFTTPEAWDLNALFARMVTAGCTYVVMEASSQALEQGRLLGLQFALAIFTNLSQDHLDYHGDMENYYQAKKLLFLQCDKMLVNIDDPAGKKLISEDIDCEKKTYSSKQSADFYAHDPQYDLSGVEFFMEIQNRRVAVHFPMPGKYSVDNALAVVGGAVMLGLAPAKAVSALAQTEGVPGRCEVIYDNEFTVVSDFAHTAEAIENLLAALSPFVKNRMIVLFGCAGDRDAGKRPAMSRAVCRYADMIYLTSDNPRTEDLDKIAQDALPEIIKSGIPYVVKNNREKAVHMALSELQEGDMLVLCGKGHEDYQVLDGITIYFSERLLIKSWMLEK